MTDFDTIKNILDRAYPNEELRPYESYVHEGKFILEFPQVDEWYSTCQHTDPTGLLIESTVCCICTLSGLSSDRYFRYKQGETECKCQNYVYQQKDAATVFGSEIRESPDISETYRTCCRGKDESE